MSLISPLLQSLSWIMSGQHCSKRKPPSLTGRWSLSCRATAQGLRALPSQRGRLHCHGLRDKVQDDRDPTLNMRRRRSEQDFVVETSVFETTVTRKGQVTIPA